jgi:hypothetical protein
MEHIDSIAGIAWAVVGIYCTGLWLLGKVN